MNNATKVSAVAGSFAAGMALMYGIDRTSPPAPLASATPEVASSVDAPRAAKPGAVKVELFVMSQCPYGVQAEALFKEVADRLGADVDLRLEYIGDVGPTGQLGSMHGPKEVRGDLVQVCAQKHTAKWFELVLCQNEDWKNVDTNWQACAARLGIPTEPLAKCVDGGEGTELLKASFQLAKQRGITGSPTIAIGGKEYDGHRRPNDIIRAVCRAAGDAPPAICSEIPEPPKVTVTLLSDRRCAECDTRRLQGAVAQAVTAPEFTVLDVGDAEGRELAKSLKIEKLPAIVFDASLDADEEAAAQIKPGTRAEGERRVVEVGEWQPACADANGCKLDACKESKQCIVEVPGRLEVFVMSQCPFGVKGLDAMRPVLEHFDAAGDKLDFRIHFIGDGDESSLSSMHGAPEVEEDLREACAIEHFAKGRRYMDYIWCRNPKIQSPEWQTCAGAATGIDAEVLRKCSEGAEGKKLLARSFAFSKKQGIGASPTWRANGKFEFSGIDPQEILKGFCSHNPELKGCKTELAGGRQPARGVRPSSAPPPSAAEPGCGEPSAAEPAEGALGCGE